MTAHSRAAYRNPFVKIVKVVMLTVSILMLCNSMAAHAASLVKIETPPLTERWFGIYVDNERVGFYRQRIEKSGDGYKMEGNGSVRMKVMSFSKEASMRETYQVSKNLSLRSFDVDQTINGSSSHLSGKVIGNIIQIKSEASGKTSEKDLKFRGDVYPGPALNLYPLMRGGTAGTQYKIQAFDPEDLKIKEIQITILGAEKTADGVSAIKLRNTLYPFVNNDIWVDELGNTLEESVREGLVTTKAEQPQALGQFISDWALAKKDLIYDFSLVRTDVPIKDPKNLTGLAVEISNWNDILPLLQGGGQRVEKHGEGRVVIKTGVLAKDLADSDVQNVTDAQLRPADKIESDAPEIKAQVKLLTDGIKTQDEMAKILASWTSDWLKDTIDDGGSAVESFKSKSGNCQTHARLYTALARAAGIPTRFVSGLVYIEGKGFLYHSWAESFIGRRWVSVDPTYNQLPTDPTHLKLLEGHLPEDMAPIIAIIGRIKMTVLETSYENQHLTR
ncbi:MAG: transglutaminase-like domain-containing protein [Desulfuromonadaceae bacterium]|nr:transglutaminase-like domain-containing protein [Desulfuromonadaceae bacterium]